MNDDILQKLCDVLEQRKLADAAESYTAGLLQGKPDKIRKKIGEEATELVMASKSGEKDDIIHETADLLFHALVLLAHHDLSIDDIYSELEKRFGLSGLEEKANRGN